MDRLSKQLVGSPAHHGSSAPRRGSLAPRFGLVEFVGPQGVGKTTVAQLVASEIGIPCHHGQGGRQADGDQMTPRQIRKDRIVSVIRFPMLYLRALASLNTDRPARLRLSLNIVRRNRFAADLSGGILEGGPVHGACQAAANTGTNLSALSRRVVSADVYVRLRADSRVIAERFSCREGHDEVRDAHADWIQHYDASLDALLVGRNVIEVDASGSPTEVAASVLDALERYKSPDAECSSV